MSVPDPVKIQLGARRERIALFVGILLIAVAGIPLWMISRPEAARSRIQVLAHRGASAYAPRTFHETGTVSPRALHRSSRGCALGGSGRRT